MLSGLVAITCGCHIPRFHYERVEQRELETSPLNVLDLTTFNGGIEVLPHDKPLVEMEITYKAYAASEAQAEANCELLDCEVEADDGTLIIKATKPSNQWMASVSFKLKVPQDCALKLRSSNGKIEASDFVNGVEAISSNGTIALTNIGTLAKAKTSNGTVRVENSNSAIDLETSNGKVYYSGQVVGSDNRISTSNGRVEMKLPVAGLVEIETKTSNGSIKCTLPTQRISKEKKREFNAIVGDGDLEDLKAKLKVRTSNGSIKIEPLETVTESDDKAEVDNGALVL